MRFQNLRAELFRYRISIGEVGRELKVSRGTVFGKFAGKTEWKLSEVDKIIKILYRESGIVYSAEYLFSIGVVAGETTEDK
ncbi:MAG: hypothetical protein II306_04220 [Clostridia bacterium]|nr:hypothetical protein [Clostridia bacterium]